MIGRHSAAGEGRVASDISGEGHGSHLTDKVDELAWGEVIWFAIFVEGLGSSF
jgi:hypothetical protein